MRPNRKKKLLFFLYNQLSVAKQNGDSSLGRDTFPSCLSALLHRKLPNCSKTQLSTSNNALPLTLKKSLVPKHPAKLFHGQNTKIAVRSQKNKGNLARDWGICPLLPCHQECMNNSSYTSWACTVGMQQPHQLPTQPPRNGWEQQKWVLPKEKGLHSWAALPSQTLPAKGLGAGIRHYALIYRKVKAHWKYSPGCRKYRPCWQQTGINR